MSEEAELRYFEDLEVGETVELGSTTVTADEIVDFARRYDPQPFHLRGADDLIASGWHTTAVCMRLLVDGFLGGVASAPALGVDNLRWRTPVRPGDTLTATVTVADTDDWSDDRGLVSGRLEAENDRGEEVLTRTDLVLFERRPGGG